MSPELCFLIYIGGLFTGLGIFIFILNKPRKKKEVASTDSDDEDDLIDYDDKITYLKEEEKCSFCGSTGHTIGGCPVFLSCM